MYSLNAFENPLSAAFLQEHVNPLGKRRLANMAAWRRSRPRQEADKTAPHAGFKASAAHPPYTD
jgi:hypothetical protein